jgi:hypothetical protein
MYIPPGYPFRPSHEELIGPFVVEHQAEQGNCIEQQLQEANCIERFIVEQEEHE